MTIRRKLLDVPPPGKPTVLSVLLLASPQEGLATQQQCSPPQVTEKIGSSPRSMAPEQLEERVPVQHQAAAVSAQARELRSAGPVQVLPAILTSCDLSKGRWMP